jgi:alpha-amylase
MRTICLYFEIHQIIHLKRYRFFDIGIDHYYYDDYANETSINDVAERSYIPALNTLIEMVKNSGGAFKVAFSISGVALEQLEIYAPAVIDLLHQLNDTGCCEFLAEPYSHGLSSLANEDCFKEEVMRQSAKMKQMFGKAPKVFRIPASRLPTGLCIGRRSHRRRSAHPDESRRYENESSAAQTWRIG